MTECILSGHAGASKELLVTASDVSRRLVLWRLLLEYINLIILRRFYGKLCACANSVYQAVFFGLGTRLQLQLLCVLISSPSWPVAHTHTHTHTQHYLMPILNTAGVLPAL